MKKVILLATVSMMFAHLISAQNVSVNNDGTAAHPSAILDVSSCISLN